MKIERHQKKSSENESIIIAKSDDFEFVKPLEKFREQMFSTRLYLGQLAIDSNPGIFENVELVKKMILQEAHEDWLKQKEKLISKNFPDELKELLKTTKKREQIKLLKNMTLKSSELNSFIVYAHHEFGYLYSMYKKQIKPKGYEADQIPMAIINESDTVERFSGSELSDGQIKQIIDHQKFHVARFIDLEESWHCFFYTLKSLKGKELQFRDDRPHVHYISSAWSLSREEVLSQLMSEKYRFKSTPHIDFIRYDE